MNAIIILLVCSLFVAAGFLFAFIWNVKDGQYEDNFSPANRILYDDSETEKNTKN
jgi:cbb3-type cytochrome oxidase maturation protein